MAPRVIVFVDYENALKTAHHKWAGPDALVRDSIIHPRKLAERLVQKRSLGGDLTGVHVYRGRPDPERQRKLASANDQQLVAWEADDPRVKVHRRMLSYPDDWTKENEIRASEKGIDVWLGVDLVRLGFEREYDVAIVFSRDSDLEPAILTAYDLEDVHVEVATWKDCSRISMDDGRDLWCHYLDQNDWIATRDVRSYRVLGDGGAGFPSALRPRS